jgi:hypothetical protein
MDQEDEEARMEKERVEQEQDLQRRIGMAADGRLTKEEEEQVVPFDNPCTCTLL